MTITLQLFAGLNESTDSGERERRLELTSGATVGDALEFLRLAPTLWAIILVNGIHATPSTCLKDGDVLAVFPPVAGG